MHGYILRHKPFPFHLSDEQLVQHCFFCVFKYIIENKRFMEFQKFALVLVALIFCKRHSKKVMTFNKKL